MGEPCARLVVEQPDTASGTGVIYLKSRWFATHFTLSISDGFNAWTCQASPEEVSRKAFSWDYTVTQYLDQAKEHLDHQNPECTYSFTPIGDGGRKLSWTLEKDGVRLVAHWKAEKSSNPKEITSDILDCLMNGSARLSEELQRKTRSFESLKSEAAQLTAQSQKFRDLKIQFEDDIYRKFVAVLNSKKAKLRELRNAVLKVPGAGKGKENDEMVDETESDREDELDESGDEDDNDESVQKRKRSDSPEQAKDLNIETADSAATQMYSDSPPGADVSSHGKSDSPPESAPTYASKEREGPSQPPVATNPVPKISPSKVQAEAMSDAASLLGGTTYVSAPRRRRR
ncbi:hypothetical protein R1sor_018362 [Riccia sorocarpa]|uniref:DNA repair protein XRCC4 n=1 Tax=Riccia sorocarpa TaxID=122646 RepID=A0ABD3ID75_9MARC